ncbi:TPR family protein [Megaselia abdita]
MEVEIETGKKILEQCLSSEEYSKLDTSVIKKIEIFVEDKFNDFLTARALAETEKTNYNDAKDNYVRQICELNYQLQEFENKLENSKLCVGNLREEITKLSTEKNTLSETLQKYTNELNDSRNHRKIVTDERDSLLRLIERKTSEVERLQSELQMSQSQVKAAIEAKCEAVIKYDSVRSKEISLEMKDKRMDQEKLLSSNQIKVLTEDLNRNIAEVQSIRRENTIKFMQLQSKLNERTEEVNILTSENADLKESVLTLTNQLKKLNEKFLAQNEETQRMMDHYKKELAAKTKLTELYKLDAESKSDESSELENAVIDLKRMLSEASDQYGKLETEQKAVQVQHEQEIEDQNKIIEDLKNEIKHANELIQEFKNESVENALGKLAPSAAVVKRLINSDMSLTELYSKYRKASEDSETLKLENSKLTLQINNILHELEERAPAIKKQELEYNKLVTSNNELAAQLEAMIMEKSAGNHELSESLARSSHLERENKKLKMSQNDLGRQVCYLLKEMEQIRCGFTNSQHSDKLDLSTDEVISKKLVTFSNIQELQENNQKLILLVRDLSNKLEEFETIQSNINESAYQSKIDNLKKKLLLMQESYDSQTKMLTTYIQKCDSLKKMCFEVFSNDDKAAMFSKGDGEMMVDGDSTLNRMSHSKSASEIQEQLKRIAELEEQILDHKNQLKKAKDDYEEYIKEKRQNDRVMNEQLDCLRSEVHELTTTNCKLKTTIEYNNEQLKIQNKNLDTYRKQIAALEERKKNYENSSAKQDETIVYLKEEAMNAHRKLSSCEIQMNNLKQEVRVLRDSEARWHTEREGYHRERQTNNLLLNNIEMIKVNFERSETEGKARLESRLDECIRETSALRRRLQEEQDNFRQLAADLKRETDKAKSRMEEEKAIADQLRNEIQECRQELASKSAQVQDLSAKLQESLTPSQNDNPIVQANKKARDLEIKLQEATLEIESMTKELEKARENAQVYCDISTKSEKELMQFMETQKDYKQKAESEIEKLKNTEQSMQIRINELETQLKLQHTTVQMSQQNIPAELQRLQEDYKLTLEKLNACNMEIRNLREQNKTIAMNLQTAEQKYAHEMMLHSSDIQELTKFKEEYGKLQEKLSTTSISETTKDLYEESKRLWLESSKLLEQEKIELEKRIEDLDHQNAVLHDQLQAWSAKQSTENEEGNNSVQLSESIVADLNSSAMDIDSKSSDKLVEIIKFLRKEKDLALGQVDILKAEKVRILSEHQVLKRKAEEMESILKEEKTKAESEIVTAYKHGEILRKVEMLNAVTDSNRVLREERDTLTSKVKDLSDQLTLAEDEIVPLKEKNRELSTKIDTYMSENSSLRSEAARWRQRANTVLTNKNSEEFKHLQLERDNLAKMLETEKEIFKQVNTELQELKSQRVSVDAELTALQKQLSTLIEDKKKFTDEVITLRSQNLTVNKEMAELKTSISQKDKDLLKLSADIEAKEAALVDVKAKEATIRGIAKRYKQSYMDLRNKYPDDENNVGEASVGNLNVEDKNQVSELTTEIQNLRQQEETLRRENEEIRTTNEKTKVLLREAKSRILNLTQSKESLQQELNTHKAQFEAFRQTQDTLKTKFDETESSLKESVAKLSRENEALRTFNRQVTKPSTSTGVIQEKSTSESASPRTANVKPMSGGSSTPNVGQQSATVQPWRGSSGETPLASIRPIPVLSNRTAAILPTSQLGPGPSTSSSGPGTSSVPGTSSSSSNTALVPPQQQVHTTGNNIEPMSSSPTSSHTDYMPATSSATVVVAAVQPMGSASAESSTEAEQQQQQAVALVSPRIESGSNVVAAPAQVSVENQQESSNNQPSTSGTASGSTSHNISISHHHASSSNSVTTTHAGGAGVSHKRPRETESEAANNTEDGADKGSLVAGPSMTKRTRTEVTESGVEVEYQVPTSSQREYDSIMVDSDEEDGCISEENNVELDEGNGEGENEGYDEGYEPNPEDMDEVEEGDQSNDIDQSNVQPGDNEVETSSEAADEMIQFEADAAQPSQVEAPQIQAISSGSSEVESFRRQAIPSTSAGLSRQQQATLLMLQKGCNETDGVSSEVSPAPATQKSDHSSHNQVTQATTSSTTSNVVQQRKVSGGEPVPGPSSEVVASDSDVAIVVEANGNVNDDDEQPTAAVQVVYQSEEEGNRTNDGSLQADAEDSDKKSGGNVIVNVEDEEEDGEEQVDETKNQNQNEIKPVVVNSVARENSDNMDPTQSVGDRPTEAGGAEEGEGMDGVTSEGEKVVMEAEDTPEIEVKITPPRFSRRLKLRKS